MLHQPFDFSEALYLSPVGKKVKLTINLDWLFSLPRIRVDLERNRPRTVLLSSMREAQQVLDSHSSEMSLFKAIG